ncbi:C40 family peptidase [Nocardia grenadensis]|uniref:C40 family peptidase n=1 Tax=Nocardia grenadensis TaxID=931537 RepID=UPI003D75BEBD
MTSAEIGPYPVEAESEAEPDNAVPQSGSPWQPGERRQWGRGTGNGSPPGAPSTPAGPAGQNGATPAGNSASAPPAAPAPNSAISAPPVTPVAAPIAAPPAVAAPVSAQPAPPAAAPAAPATRKEEPEPEPLVDPEMLAQMAPMALMAGSALLPMIGSALSGLLGGGSGAGAAAPAAETAGTPIDPQSDRAMKVLKLLEAMYGEGEPKDPEVKKLREKVGGSQTGGSGDGPAMIKAKRMFQATRATAFNNLDKQLANYCSTLAGTNKVDQNAVRQLLKQTNAALAELGPLAYTKEGQQKVRRILTAALQTAHKIVSGGTANSADTASAINQLTNQYLYNILGKELPGGVKLTPIAGSTVNGGSERAQFAVKTALAQRGDPYVWGAEGPNSFDCSGLTQYAAAKAGVKIPRVANDQYRQLPAVNPSNIQPGDLIFPSTSYKNGQYGHVMMYIGNGQVVHAPRTGDVVRVTSLPKSYEARRFA